jgi:peptidoglycan/LPS O-acetylase OafA/YrhL
MDDAAAPAVPVARTEYYPHVEGLRGVLALYVVLFHVWQYAVQNPAGTLTQWRPATTFMQYGYFAVASFIVISGYCLALPVVKRLDRPFDVKAFFGRRARRLMPAYVIVVLLSIVPFCITAVLQGRHINAPHIVIAAGMHLALVHNLLFSTAEYLNSSLWSIALEAQIYVVFALVLIPVWKRFGLAAQLAVALVLGLLPHFVLHRFDWTSPWLLGLFAMGVCAASLASRATSPRLPWSLLALVAAVLAVLAIRPFVDQVTPDGSLWTMDMFVGATVALFFVAAAKSPRVAPARVLATRPIVLLGTFSYSLYLIHAPLVALTGALLARMHAGTVVSVLAWFAVIVLVVVLAYGTYLVAERPFLSPRYRALLDAETAGEGAHAPAAITTQPAA